MATPYNAEYKKVQRESKASAKQFTVLHESAIIINTGTYTYPIWMKKITGGQYIGPFTARHNTPKAVKKLQRKQQTRQNLNLI